MAEITARIILRFGTTENWTSIEEDESKILQEGELGYDTDLELLKIGDGVNKWSSLPVANYKEFAKLFATTEQGGKAETALQGVKVGEKDFTVGEDKVASISIEDLLSTLGITPDEYLKANEITGGNEQGTISVRGVDVKVKDLGSAAYTDTNAYATAAQGEKADNAVQQVSINGKSFTVESGNATLSQEDAREAIGFNPSDYATAEQGNKADSAVQKVVIGDGEFTNDGKGNASLTAEEVREILDVYTKSEVGTQITSAIEEHNTSPDAHSDIRQLIADEASTRKQADTELDKRLDAIEQSETEGVAGLQAKLDQEIKDREAADTKLQEQLGDGFSQDKTVQGEIERLEGEITSNNSDLTQKIEEEISRATTAEESLQSKLGEGFDETSTVKKAIDDLTSQQETLESQITDTQTKLGDGFSADNTVAKAIEDAKAEASTATRGVSDELAKEVERARAAEQANTTNIQTNTASIEAEVKRATGKETEIEDKLPTEEQLLPSVTEADNDKILQVVEGQWQPVEFNSEEINQKIQQNTEAIQKNTEAIQQNTDGLAEEIRRAKGVEGELTSLTTSSKSSLVDAINSEVEARQQADSGLTNRVGSIEGKIPAQASATNQLADKEFVNSSIAAQAARFITPSADRTTLWSSFTALEEGPWYYEGEEIEQCENNDYATYLVPATEEGAPAQQWRAIYQKDEPVGTPGGKWVAAYQYNTVWTAKQKAAIDSGITEDKVNTYDGYDARITTAQNIADAAMPKAGGTFTGPVTLNADPIEDLGAATKQYVDSVKTDITSQLADYAPKESPTFTGNVTVPAPTQDTDAATKKYIDDKIKEATGEEAGSTDDKIKKAIGDLDATISEIENNYIASITQTDGKIAAGQKPLPVVEIKGSAPINTDTLDGVVTVSHDTKEVTSSTDDSSTNIITEIEADETGHLSSYKTNTLENALKALGVITIRGGKATDLT